MKDYLILRSYENGLFDELKGIKNIQNFGVVYEKEVHANLMNGKYEIFYYYDDLLNYEKLENILKDYGYNLKDYILDGKIKNELLELIFNSKLRYKLKIVEVNENSREIFYKYESVGAGERSDYFKSLSDIRNYAFKFKMKRIF